MLLALMLSTTPAPAVAACNASSLYAGVKSSAGGAAWNGVAEVVSRGTVAASGLHGTFALDVDVRHGRSSLQQALGVQRTWEVNDGTLRWQMDYSRGVHPLNAPNARAGAVTAAYVNRNGPWDPAHDAASFQCLGSRTRDGQTFDVVRVTPRAGLPVEQWIDRDTHLVGWSFVRGPTSTGFTRYSDYRQAGGLVLPFTIRIGSVGDSADDVALSVTSVDRRRSLRSEDFRRPPDPADTRMLAGHSTSVPLSIEAGDAIVFAKIDGKGPFPFILDTGGHAILTPAAARAIGLQMQGAASSGGGGSGRVSVAYTFVRSLQLGNAVIPNQPFLVIGYDNDFSDRGARAPIAGILGLEVFERFAVRIDYARPSLTLTSRGAYEHNGDAVRAALVFQEDMPLTEAAADGTPGLFGVDTGNSGSPIMFGPFLERHGFLARYAPGSSASGKGTGGTVHSVRQVVKSLSIGGRTFRDVVTYFVLGQKGGSFSSSTEAGNLGYQVLANFVPTFDYATGSMYLERTSGVPAPAIGRSGLALSKQTRAAFHVDGVRANSPAAKLGIETGDEVISIDAKSAAALGNADVYAIMRGAPGSVVTLVVRRGSASRTVKLRLQDLPPR